jgi:cyclic-di-AMP phosphodiesterase PgpH
MKTILMLIRDKHALWYKGVLFVATLALILYFFPRETRFRYDVANLEGRPWPYENLIAPFDFAIKKNPVEVEAEREALRRNFKPYYRFEDQPVLVLKNRVRQLRNISTADMNMLQNNIDAVYQKGVRAELSEGKSMLIVRGNLAEEIYFDRIPRISQADSLILAGVSPAARFIWRDSIGHGPANLKIDSALTKQSLQQALENISPARGALSKDQIIVSRGEIVDADKFQELLSLQEEYQIRSRKGGANWLILLGQMAISAFCLFLLFQFLRLFRREILGDDSRLLFILLMVLLTVCMSYLPAIFPSLPLIALPFCILPVIMRAFFDTRLALFTHIITIFIITVGVPNDRFDFVLTQMLSGIIAIFSIVNMRNRSQLFFSVVVIFASYVLLHLGLKLLLEGDVRMLHLNDFAAYGVSTALVLLAYPLIFLFEKIFGFVSDVTLLELSDTNSPLLRELAEKAPGTFQHSIQVANLAEEAIRRIGGNALLMRAGALYHDIGKADMPVYFIENQATGINPHDELSFEESARIIIGHVIRGIEKAKAQKLPEPVIDFIRTHHGTTNTAYFLTLYKRNNPEDTVDEELFRYPGPIPYSKETAVLMMADSVEASSRSLSHYDAESIDALVEKIVAHQLELNQFDNADITLKDITTIKKIFKKKLRSIYHVRVEYPQ